MSQNVRISSAGIDRLLRKAEERETFLAGDNIMRSIFAKSASELVVEYKKTIKTFTPGKVRDLTEATKKQKVREVGRAYPILDRTGELIKSMVPVVRYAQRVWGIRVAFKGTHPTGHISNERLAKIHATGEGRMPQRDFTGLPKQWRRRLMDRIRAELKRRG